MNTFFERTNVRYLFGICLPVKCKSFDPLLFIHLLYQIFQFFQRVFKKE